MVSNDPAHLPGPPRWPHGTKSRHAGRVRWSGKEALSPAPPPLRTARAGFLACGSSIGQRIHKDTRLPHWPWVNLSVTTPEPATERTSVAAVAPARVFATPPTSASQPTPVD